MATRSINNRPRKALHAEQKIAFALLVFLGLGGIVLGFRSFGSHLYRPIQQQMAKYYTGQDVVNLDQPDVKEIEDQKKKDSDADGISDYDELYVYKISPYIKDSDSDGIDDKTEVFGGTDPNCPKGKDCAGGGEVVNTNQTDVQSVLGGMPGNDDIVQSGIPQLQTKEDIQNFFQKATIQEVRNALVQAGVSQAEIDQVSDEDLQKMFDQSISTSAQTNSQSGSAVTGGSTGSVPVPSAVIPTGNSKTNP